MKRIIALLLAAIMLVACALSFTSCKDDEPANNNNNNQNNTNDQDEEVKTFGGRTFTIFSRGSADGPWEAQDIYAEAENGDRINDAVYKRNANVEAKHDVKIQNFPGAALATAKTDAYNQIYSGTAEFDVIAHHYQVLTYLAQNKQLVNLYDIEYLNLDQPWWDQNANHDLSIGDALYFTCSDLLISDLDGTWFVIFNKQILEDKQLQNPYQLVYDDEWTWDKYFEMAKAGSHDLTGDGKMGDDDQYGIATESWDTVAMFYGAGCSITSKDNDNFQELSIYNDYSVRVMEKIYEMVNDTDMYSTRIEPKVYVDNGCKGFFVPTTVMAMRLNFNNMTEDFGILPVPKFDKNQDRYYHLVSLHGTVGVPITSTDYEFVGTVLESLTEESSKILIPEYYNEILENRYLRDEESRDMLEIVFGTRVFDIGYLYNVGGFYNYIRNDIKAGSSNTFASTYDSVVDTATAELEAIVDVYRNMQ